VELKRCATGSAILQAQLLLYRPDNVQATHLIGVLNIFIIPMRLRPDVQKLVDARTVTQKHKTGARRLADDTSMPLVYRDDMTVLHHEILQRPFVVLIRVHIVDKISDLCSASLSLRVSLPALDVPG